MSRDFYRNRSKLGSIPQVSVAKLPVIYTYNMSSQPAEMTFISNNATYFNGQWYCNPTDKSGQLKSNFSFPANCSNISIKAKITNCRDTWWNHERIAFAADDGTTIIASIESSSGANGTNDGGFFKATNGAGFVTQAINSNWGTYYLEIVATPSLITFKIYDSSNSLLHTLSGTYTTGKTFADIKKAYAMIYSSSAGGAYMDDLVISYTG